MRRFRRLLLGLISFLTLLLAHEQLAPLSAAESARLTELLKPILARHQGKVSVAVKNLSTGEEFSQDADREMPTASLIKFPVMVAAYRLVDAGKLDLSQMITLRAEDKVQGSGILTTHFSPGTQITIRDAIRLMIAYSDNTATNLVLDQIALPTTAETMEQLGFPRTKVHAKVFRGDTSIFPERSKQFGLGSTTAADMVKLLEMLHEKKLASEGSCKAMLDHLLACEDKEKFPRELPPGTKVAHKTGSVNAVRTDAGIIFCPQGPVAVCVLTAENKDQRWNRENGGDRLCARVAKVVYDHFTTPKIAEADAPQPLALGASGPIVESLQRTLNARLSPSPELGVDGEFGPATRDSVLRFQKQRKLASTGEMDAATWRALGPLIVTAEPVAAPNVVNSEKLPVDRERNWSFPPLVTCKAWAIADAKTGVLLWGHQEREPLDFASTTKIMTAYIVLKMAETQPKILDEVITFSERADQTVGSTADLKAGERVSVRELLYGLMLPSGNDAATAFAEHFGSKLSSASLSSDSVERFVAEMNRTAEEIGMKDTRYANPHGLTSPGHVSTAADLLVLARAARRLPSFCNYVKTRQHGCTVDSVSGYTRNVIWKNTNKLLGLEGYNGLKTGTTEAAGACLVSSGQQLDDELLVVVLGSASSDARYVDSRNLFRWAWSQRRSRP